MKVVVVSPHLDDAAFSIGATLRALADRGAEVRVLTVFAGDPDRTTPPSYWDSERGLATAADATLQRRQEDTAASEVLGYEPAWLSFDDSGYVYQRDPDAIMAAARPFIDDATVVMVPGWPLDHMDHRYTGMMMLERITDKTIVLYSELPYAASPRNLLRARLRGRNPLRTALGEKLVWSSAITSRSDRAAKRAAIACYRGEVSALGYRAQISAAYERVMGREMLGHDPSIELPSEFRFR